MSETTRRSPLIPLARIATLVAIGDLMTKQVALLWIGSLDARASSAIRFGVVHNDKGAFGLTVGDYTWELSLALTLGAIFLIVPVAKDLSRIDDRAPTALGLVAGGAIGNLVSLLLSPAGVVDFIAVQRANGAGIVLNIADVAAYAGVVMLMRTAAKVVKAMRRNREASVVEAAVAMGRQRETAITRLADVEVPMLAAHDSAPAPESETPSAARGHRPPADRQVDLRLIRAERVGEPSGRALAARLRSLEAGPRAQSVSPYLRPMSHTAETRSGR